MRWLSVLLILGVAQAHDSGEAKATLTVADGLTLELTMARADAAELLGLPDDASDSAVDARLDEEAVPALQKWLVVEGCEWTDVKWAPSGVRGVKFTARSDCEVGGGVGLSWPAGGLTALKLDLVAGVTGPGGENRFAKLGRETASARVTWADPSPTGFFVLGVEHMLTGWDHLAFLLALVLACSRLKRLLIIVTSFTVAHSVTLALGATGVITLSGDIVEPIIAASIAVAAGVALYRLVQDTLTWPGHQRAGGSLSVEMFLVFGFGLIHGLGFAGLLGELAPNMDGLALPLLTFNLGVEVGQVAAVAVAFPLLGAVGRSRAAKPVFGALLAGLVGLGVFVAVQRVVG